MGSDSAVYPEEITCMDQSYNGFLDLSYTYAMETISGVNIYDVIANLEGEIMIKLSETVLTCGGNIDEVDGKEVPFDRKELGIVGVNSLPPDTPSELSNCVSAFNDCTIVHGSLTLFLRQNADLENVRYAARYVINEAMKSNYFAAPRVDFLIGASYRGPKITKPDPQTFASAEVNTGSESPFTKTVDGMNTLNKVIIATLCSAIVGIVAAFVLFKKVFNSRQNCFASCDGTGVDRAYIEEAHFRSPSNVGKDNMFPMSVTQELDENQVVEYDIANGLQVIHETSDTMSSMNESYDSSTMTNFSSRLNASCDFSVAWSEAKSMASEKTLPTSNGNRLRTPTFGDNNQKVRLK